jgi:peptidoglycan/LPS O-acetylase OafA/YrhL
MRTRWLRRFVRLLTGRDTDKNVYVSAGVVAGLLFGVLYSLLMASASGGFEWDQALRCFGQFGFACPFLGGLIGYIVFGRRRRGSKS